MVLRRTVCGEAVERSAGRRRAVDSAPLHTQGSLLLRPQRHHRVDLRRATGGDGARQQRDADEHD